MTTKLAKAGQLILDVESTEGFETGYWVTISTPDGQEYTAVGTKEVEPGETRTHT